MSVNTTRRIAFAPTKKTRWLFLLVCTLFHLSDATIRIVGDGTEFLSRPDNYVGLQFKAGMEYAARIQRVHGDNHLCGGNRMHVHAPDDGRPVALLVKKGKCSYAQKAEWASRNVYPKGVVKILIIDGERRIQDEDHTKFLPDTEDHSDSPLTSYEYPSYYNGDNDSTVTLQKKHADDISVALLHVSYQTGVDLEDLVINEDPDAREAGGILVTVDSDAPPINNSIIWIWTAVCFALSCVFCCCLGAYLEELADSQRPEPEPPRRPRRRRLTFEQVRKFPIGVFDGNQLVYDEEEDDVESGDSVYIQPVEHSLDACTICLDEYEVGDKLRCLPCGHAFDANCIAKWLIERSATCPLCNLDLYEEEEEEEEEPEEQEPLNGQASEELVEETTASERQPWWRNIFRRTQHRDTVNEALTEPLLPEGQEQESENTLLSEPIETPLSEESDAVTTSHDEEIVHSSSSE